MTSENDNKNLNENGSETSLNDIVNNVNENTNNDMENDNTLVKEAITYVSDHIQNNAYESENYKHDSHNDNANVSHETNHTDIVEKSNDNDANMNANSTIDNSELNTDSVSSNAGSVIVNNVKGFFTDNSGLNGDRANKWSYILMIAITLLAVFATIFGSYEYHQRVNIAHTFTAVYDNDSKTWYTDPMNGHVMKIKQFNNKDMRIYTTELVNPITNDYGNPILVKNVDKFKWENGLIANITCNKPVYNTNTNELSCYGSIVVNTYNVDETVLDYAKTISMKTDLKKQVITRIDR